MIHQRATAQTLGLVRFWVFGIWLVLIAIDPFYLMAEFPRSVLKPIGLLRLVPNPFGRS